MQTTKTNFALKLTQLLSYIWVKKKYQILQYSILYKNIGDINCIFNHTINIIYDSKSATTFIPQIQINEDLYIVKEFCKFET